MTYYRDKFIRWEFELALNLDLPMIIVNSNDLRKCDYDLCLPVIRHACVHVPFKARIIAYAFEKFPDEFANRYEDEAGSLYYPRPIYCELGL